MDIKPSRPTNLNRPVQPPRPPRRQQPLLAKLEPEALLTAGKKEPLLPAKMPNPSRKKWWFIGVGAIIVLLLAAGAGAWWWYNDALQPRSSTVQRIRLTIMPGSTPDQIAEQLQSKGVIKSGLAFQWLLKQSGDRDKLQAGTYLLSPTQPAREVLNWLIEGKVDAFNVTILPGKTLADIKAALVGDGFKAEEIDAAFNKKYDHPLLASKPDNVNLEGYIYPETYQINSETSVEQFLVRTFDEFYQQIQAKGLQPGLAAHGFTLHQGITLGSIVQMEVSHDADRRQVAQVFEKRLSIDMELGSDVTYMYAAKLTGQTASPSLDSPYNTRRYKGLPPGAISNMTLSSLQAVADPAPGDYLFFVAGDDGVTHFARTNAEHEANVKQYCTKLCFE
jgi:UPF0755 protein